MSKCILDIKFDITDTARDLAMDNGGFTYIHGERDSLRMREGEIQFGVKRDLVEEEKEKEISFKRALFYWRERFT